MGYVETHLTGAQFSMDQDPDALSETTGTGVIVATPASYPKWDDDAAVITEVQTRQTLETFTLRFLIPTGTAAQTTLLWEPPWKILLVDAYVVPLANCASGTYTLNNTTNPITNTITADTADTIGRPSTMDDTYWEIDPASSETFTVTHAGSADQPATWIVATFARV